MATSEASGLHVVEREAAVAVVLENPPGGRQTITKQREAVDERVSDDGRHVVEVVLVDSISATTEVSFAMMMEAIFFASRVRGEQRWQQGLNGLLTVLTSF